MFTILAVSVVTHHAMGTAVQLAMRPATVTVVLTVTVLATVMRVINVIPHAMATLRVPVILRVIPMLAIYVMQHAMKKVALSVTVPIMSIHGRNKGGVLCTHTVLKQQVHA